MPAPFVAAHGLDLAPAGHFEETSVAGIHADPQQVALWGHQLEFIDQCRAQILFVRGGPHDPGPDQAAAIAVVDAPGKVVEGQRAEVLCRRGRAENVSRQGGWLIWRNGVPAHDREGQGNQGKNKKATASHGPFMRGSAQMKTKQPVGIRFGIARLKTIRAARALSLDRQTRKEIGMSSKFLKLHVAALAMVAGLGTTAFAQDTQVPADDQMPAALSALNLQNVETKQGPRGGRKIEGDLPGGGEIEAFVDRDNNPVMVEAEDVALPQSLIDALLPQSVRNSDILSQFAEIERVGGRDGRFMVAGEDADGEDLRAGFDADGRLLRFGRGDDDHGKRGWREHRNEDRADKRQGGRHGEMRHGEMRHEMRGEGRMRGDGPQGEGPQGDGPRSGGRMPMVDTAALNDTLSGAGYSEITQPRPTGPRLQLDAVNPAGEAVTLEVAPDGEVIREVAR